MQYTTITLAKEKSVGKEKEKASTFVKSHSVNDTERVRDWCH